MRERRVGVAGPGLGGCRHHHGGGRPRDTVDQTRRTPLLRGGIDRGKERVNEREIAGGRGRVKCM